MNSMTDDELEAKRRALQEQIDEVESAQWVRDFDKWLEKAKREYVKWVIKEVLEPKHTIMDMLSECNEIVYERKQNEQA